MLPKYLQHTLLTTAMGLLLNTAYAATAETTVAHTNQNVTNISFQGGSVGGATGVTFQDSFTFNVPQRSDLSGFVTPLNLTFSGFTLISHISDLKLSIYQPNASLPSGSGTSFTILGQPGGLYTGKITGTVLAGDIGAYKGNVFATLSPVPEPETYLMLLAGLAVIGVAASRRQKKFQNYSFA